MSRDYEQVLEELRKLSPDDRKRAFATLKRERQEREAVKKEQLQMLPDEHWSKAHLLQRIENPTRDAYEQKIVIPEFTFLGVQSQPDFGELLLTFYPSQWTIELKSLKVYKDSFRDTLASYERLANVVFGDLMKVYEPTRLRLMMTLRPRGGLASCLTIDSDWAIRGGHEQFADWQNNVDAFGFETYGAVRL